MPSVEVSQFGLDHRHCEFHLFSADRPPLPPDDEGQADHYHLCAIQQIM